MRGKSVGLSFLSMALVGGLVSALGASFGEARPQGRLEPEVETQLRQSPETPVWVYLKGEADLSRAESIGDRLERRRYVVSSLQTYASKSQAGVRAFLDARGVRYRSFFVVNGLLVYADRALVEALSARSDVRRIAPNPTFNMLGGSLESVEANRTGEATGVEWNVTALKVPEVWASGYRGQGVVVAGNDTGVEWNHPAIINRYRGNAPGGVSHAGNWFDAVNGRAAPYDDHSHGTFTVGQMVGDDGKGNQIGVAPDAQWIACKNMNSGGWGNPGYYTACFEWFMAPTDASGANPDPAKAPDVINNSWGCPREEGCDAETLHGIVNTVQAAGIMLVFSAGNEGPSCGTVVDPPGTYPEVLSCGATDSSGNIAGFSSRGPSSYDRSLKPNVSAPGASIRSCVPGGGYSYMSGTSMASPEVAAVSALIWSARPELKGNFDVTTGILESTATRKRAIKCGVDGASGANNIYGYGLVNARAAVDRVVAGTGVQ